MFTEQNKIATHTEEIALTGKTSIYLNCLLSDLSHILSHLMYVPTNMYSVRYVNVCGFIPYLIINVGIVEQQYIFATFVMNYMTRVLNPRK